MEVKKHRMSLQVLIKLSAAISAEVSHEFNFRLCMIGSYDIPSCL